MMERLQKAVSIYTFLVWWWLVVVCPQEDAYQENQVETRVI